MWATASGLSLVTAAIILWNTGYLSRAIDDLKARDLPVDDALLEHLSPLGWKHINLTRDYVWRQNRREMKPECLALPLLPYLGSKYCDLLRPVPSELLANEMNHRPIDSNEIKMHIAEDGEGALVVLCHGFPELWYSWRHQLKALAEAGYHVVAPDQRGYGQTDRPEAVEEYNLLQLSGDIIGLVDAIGETEAVVVGHDWGSAVAYFCSLLRPDIFRAVVLLSVPYLQRSWADIRPTEAMKQIAGENEFYQLYFQEPGKAEQELEADVRRDDAHVAVPQRRAMHLRTTAGAFCSASRKRFLTSAQCPKRSLRG